MADYPLRSATDRRLGEPLPHQLANQTQAHPSPIKLWRKNHVILSHYEVLITVSSGYPSVKGRLPTRYSPVRRFQLLPSTEVSFRSITLDLHVLGTPPAFILSQDQTLKLWYLIVFRRLNLTHKRTSCVSLLLFLFFKEIVRWLSNIVWTSYQSLLIVFCTLNLMRTEALIEKNLIFSFDSISTLCSFQCSRSTWRGTLLYYQTQVHLSTTFFKFFKTIFELGAVVSDSFYILPNLSFFVNYFFHLFSDFVVESSDSVVLFDTALSIYQTIPALSTGFLQIFWYFSFLFDNFRKLNKSL